MAPKWTTGNWLVAIATASATLTLLSIATLWAVSKERVYNSELLQWRGHLEPRLQLRYMHKVPGGMASLLYNHYVQNTCRSYSGTWSYLFRQLGSSQVRLIDSSLHQEPTPTPTEAAADEFEMPQFCRSGMIRCTVIAHFDKVSLVVVSPVREYALGYREFVYVKPYPRYQPVLIPTATPWRRDLMQQQQQQQEQQQNRPAPKTLPHFCAHAPTEAPPSGKTPNGRFVLFPARSSTFTEYFLGSVNNASDKLDTPLNLEHLNVVYTEAGPSPKLPSILKGVVFPEADIPKEVVYHFYCLNIPVFLPAVDLRKIWQFGSYHQRSAVEHCNDEDTGIKAHKTKLDMFNALHWVKTYRCYYDLIEQIKNVESSDIRNKMWQENQDGYKDMTAFIQDLKKRSVNRKHAEGE